MSAALHFVLVGLAVRVTGWTAPAPTATPLERSPFVYVAPQEEPRPTPPSGHTSPAAGRTQLPGLPELEPIPRLDLSVTGIPDPSLGQLPRAEDLFERRPLVADRRGDGGRHHVSGDGPLPEDRVDRPIAALPGTPPRYPAVLRDAGLEGMVYAAFVVDTTGRVEPGSVRILEATHDLFARAVRESLGRARFTPAEAGGTKVRQLAEQRFSFHIERD